MRKDEEIEMSDGEETASDRKTVRLPMSDLSVTEVPELGIVIIEDVSTGTTLELRNLQARVLGGYLAGELISSNLDEINKLNEKVNQLNEDLEMSFLCSTRS